MLWSNFLRFIVHKKCDGWVSVHKFSFNNTFWTLHTDPVPHFSNNHQHQCSHFPEPHKYKTAFCQNMPTVLQSTMREVRRVRWGAWIEKTQLSSCFLISVFINYAGMNTEWGLSVAWIHHGGGQVRWWISSKPYAPLRPPSAQSWAWLTKRCTNTGQTHSGRLISSTYSKNPLFKQQRLTVYLRKLERVMNLLSQSLPDYYLSSLSKCQLQKCASSTTVLPTSFYSSLL